MHELVEVEENKIQKVNDNYLDINIIVEQVNAIQKLMKTLMKENEHYGVIPGTKKPTLLKPGAELLSVMFQLRPEYEIKKEQLENGHINYEITCNLFNKITSQPFGSGVGSCSTMESKFRYRNEGADCPNCGKTAIIRGKKEYGGGWLCWAKKGGCGTKFDDSHNFESKKVDNPDIADLWNTVLKIAKKRSHVDAMLTATSASDIFTQDMEDVKENTEASYKKKSEMQPSDFPDFIKEPIRILGWNFGKLKELWTNCKGDIRQIKKTILVNMFGEVLSDFNDKQLDDIWTSSEQAKWDSMETDKIINKYISGE